MRRFYIVGMLAGLVVLQNGLAQAADPLEGYESRKLEAERFFKAPCQELWFMRNSIYAAKKYCFKEAKEKEAFGNDGCKSSTPEEILNEFELANVATILKVEQDKGCVAK